MRVLSLAMVGVATVVFVGCSSKLKQDEARAKVETFDRFQETYDESVQTNTPDRLERPTSKALIELGYATSSRYMGMPVLVLTDRGKAQSWKAIGEDPWISYQVPVARRKVENVTVANIGPNAAEAEVRWRWEFTEIGQKARSISNNAFNHLVQPDVRSTVFVFKKYDDGWRPTAYRDRATGLDDLK